MYQHMLICDLIAKVYHADILNSQEVAHDFSNLCLRMYVRIYNRGETDQVMSTPHFHKS